VGALVVLFEDLLLIVEYDIGFFEMVNNLSEVVAVA
jgi:hypothetical protein